MKSTAPELSRVTSETVYDDTRGTMRPDRVPRPYTGYSPTAERWAMQQRGVPPFALRVLAAIARHANEQDGTGAGIWQAWPSIRTLAREMNCESPSQVQRAVTQLRDAGLLVVVRRGGYAPGTRTGGRATRYRLPVDNAGTVEGGARSLRARGARSLRAEQEREQEQTPPVESVEVVAPSPARQGQGKRTETNKGAAPSTSRVPAEVLDRARRLTEERWAVEYERVKGRAGKGLRDTVTGRHAALLVEARERWPLAAAGRHDDYAVAMQRNQHEGTAYPVTLVQVLDGEQRQEEQCKERGTRAAAPADTEPDTPAVEVPAEVLDRCYAVEADRRGATLTEGQRRLIAGMVGDLYEQGPEGFDGWSALPVEARAEWVAARWAYRQAPTVEGRDALDGLTRDLAEWRPPATVLQFRLGETRLDSNGRLARITLVAVS